MAVTTEWGAGCCAVFSISYLRTYQLVNLAQTEVNYEQTQIEILMLRCSTNQDQFEFNHSITFRLYLKVRIEKQPRNLGGDVRNSVKDKASFFVLLYQ